jgi:hypothetical protein
VDTRHPPVIPHPLNDQHGILEKDGSLLSKRQPYSGVQQCHQRHAPTTNSSKSFPLTNRPNGHRNPSPSAATRAASAHHQRTAGPCPNTPHNHLRCAESGPSPARGPTVHHRQLPRLVRFPGPWPVPTAVRPASCTAAQYSNAADQHRPTTSATGRRPAEITTFDCPARSSGRRGRRFRSYNSTAGTRSRRPSPAADVADVAVSGLWNGWDTLSTLSYLVSVGPFRKSAAIRALTAGQAFSPS